MKKLEDIPKKDFFNAPEGYFEGLPTKITARLEQAKPAENRSVFLYSLRYALPVVVLAVIGIVWFSQPKQAGTDAESMLTAISTDALVEYLAESDLLSDDDYIQEFAVNAEDAEALEQAVFDLQWEDENLDDLLDELTTNNL